MTILYKIRQLKNKFGYKYIRKFRYGFLYNQAAESGHLTPLPYEIKHLIIMTYAQIYNLRILVETGTYLGDTVFALRNEFSEIYSIEIDQNLFTNAEQRFHKYNHIKILHGDSGETLSQILNKLTEPCLFWLDGHYSSGITGKGKKNTPIIEELTCISTHSIQKHVILIDDARLFTGLDDYPTLSQLKHQINIVQPKYHVDVYHDIIRIYPSKADGL